MKKVLELKQKRAKLIQDARELLDRQEEEKRALSAEENEQYERMDAEIEDLTTQIGRREKQIERERSLGESNAQDLTTRSDGEAGDSTPWHRRDNAREADEYREAFARFLTRGTAALNTEELRAMQVDDDAGGGYLVAPQQMIWDLLKEVDDQVVVRNLATVHQLQTARSLGAPSLESDADDADWTAELQTGDETELGFGKRELRPYPLAKLVKISNTLLRMSQMGPERLVRERLAYKFGVSSEKAYMTGDGNKKPLGVFTASDEGISTSRDVSEGNTSTSIMPDGLIEAKYSLKQAYWGRARWVFHRDALKQIRKLKDGEGQYIWQAGIAGGAPDRILELPYISSEFAPNTFTTGKYVGILGDFKNYWIAEALDMRIQRLVELYARTNQTGFIGRYEGDGMPVLEEAFVRVKLG